MEVGQGPNWGCSAKGKKKLIVNCTIRKIRITRLLSQATASDDPNLFIFRTAIIRRPAALKTHYKEKSVRAVYSENVMKIF
jgi:hypothetical protein